MAGFLYHIPGARLPKSADLSAVGFPLVDDASLPGGHCDTGPDGKGGCVFTVHCRNTPAVGYWPDKQTWRKAGGYWMGYENDRPPKPADLLRPDALDGHDVGLGDGNKWCIPIIRKLHGGLGVQEVIDFGEDGETIGLFPIKRFDRIVGQVRRAWETAMDLNAPPIPDRELIEIAVEALKINYMISKREIGWLRLLTTKNIATIVQATFDIPTLNKAIETAERIDRLGEDGA